MPDSNLSMYVFILHSTLLCDVSYFKEFGSTEVKFDELIALQQQFQTLPAHGQMRATALIMVSPSQTIMASAIANQRKATRYTEMNLEVAYLHPSNPTIHRGVKNVFDDLALAMTDKYLTRCGLKPGIFICYRIPAINRGVGSITFKVISVLVGAR